MTNTIKALIFSLLIFMNFFFVFSVNYGECGNDEGKCVCNPEDDVECNFYGSNACFFPVNNLLAPFVLSKYGSEDNWDISDLRNLFVPYSSKFGGCNVIYNREKGKLKIQFTKRQVDKFKGYCDKAGDPNNFDFSTILDISYWLKERNQDTFTELVNHKEDDVKIEFGEEHELKKKLKALEVG